MFAYLFDLYTLHALCFISIIIKYFFLQWTMCGIMLFCPENQSFIKSFINKVKDSQIPIEKKGVKSYNHNDVIIQK